MKRVLAVVLFTMLVHCSPSFAASREAQWKEVDEAISKGLPRTAMEKLEPIIQGALKDKAWGEAAKAIARKIVLEGNVQGNKPEEKITRMEAEIAKAPKEIVPLLDTILANWYWHYFQNNRWRFMQRTQTAQTPGKDFTTWDLPRLFAEIDRQFQQAMVNAATLKRTPITAFEELLQKGTLPDTYRPTLYDFIAHEALTFYTSGEQAAAKPEDAFELSPDAPIFDSAERFMAWDLQRAAGIVPAGEANLQAGRRYTDGDSPILKALKLYQDLLKFHRNDTDKSAFIDADLARLVYGFNVASGEEKSARYKAGLKALVDTWADHEISALALYHWARTVQQEEDLVEARTLTLRGANAYRNSPGGRLCRNLVQEIEAKSAEISTERVWNAPWPVIRVYYRNVTNIHFRAVAWDWNEFLDRRHNRPESLNEAERKQLLAKAPALTWSARSC